MDDIKTIKKIFSLTRYDFQQNFSNWLSITGLHAILMMIVFCVISFAIDDFEMSYWAWTPNMMFDWIDKFYDLFCLNQLHQWYELELFGLHMFLLALLFPVVILQNCIDLAFDSSMRGIYLKVTSFHYCFGLFFSLGFLFGAYELMSYAAAYFYFYMLQHNYLISILSVHLYTILVGFCLLYGLQLIYIFVMHLLEYQKSVLLSFYQLRAMVQGKYLFLTKILTLQILFAGVVTGMLYFGLNTVIGILMPFVVWIFDLLSIKTAPLFVFMMYNFFYAWAYILLFSWMSLVTAHVYRQLVCPPIDNVACSSCTSCEK